MILAGTEGWQTEVVVVGYCGCGGFLVKEGFAWVGGIAAVGRQRVEIGDKVPFNWTGLENEERIPYLGRDGTTTDRPTEQDRTPAPRMRTCVPVRSG